LISTWGIAELPFFTSRRSRITPGFIDDELRSSIKKINLCWYQEVGGRAVRSGTCDWDNTSHKSTFSAPLTFSAPIVFLTHPVPMVPAMHPGRRLPPPAHQPPAIPGSLPPSPAPTTEDAAPPD
jgi:hypothetical protein